MGMFLNSKGPYSLYRDMALGRFFVDKTLLIEDVLQMLVNGQQKYLCITRPRRFGKSVMAQMLGAFFSKGVDAEKLFAPLEISQSGYYREHINQHHVIYIDFSRTPEHCRSYAAYLARITDGIKNDLRQEFSELCGMDELAVWDMLQMIYAQSGARFMFVMDEWDAVFHMPFMDWEAQSDYLMFLKTLLKDQPYVELAYMTGVLPIFKYSSGSELNMFAEYDMAAKTKFSEYFGFTDAEVDGLYGIYRRYAKQPNVTREGLRLWYDGYYTASGRRLYNPRSVVSALVNDQISDYWTSSGPYDEIFYFIRNNVEEVRDDIALMVSGERIEIKLQGYSAANTELNTKNQIYSAMVVYGLLCYDYENQEVFIPNRELMEKFEELLLCNENMGYVYRLAKESGRMLRATLRGDCDTMAEILKYVHDTESPIFSYNSEIELSAVVNLAYLAARDKYRVEREEKAGEGYVDFIFYPERRNDDGIILELKTDDTPERAIQQIKDRNYALRFKGKLGEEQRYTGRILAVGISYDRKTKAHSCRVEVLK